MGLIKQKNVVSWLKMPLEELIAEANEVRRRYMGDELSLCGIVNAKSGRCSEDCKFCAQSAGHCAEVEVYPLISKEKLLEAARRAKAIGAKKLGIVTSGNKLTSGEVGTIAEAIGEIICETGMGVCGSLGALDYEQFAELKEAGLSKYHHNIETSRRYYSHIVTTHSYDQRLETIRSAKDAGLAVCSGGIIGMGETWQDRIDMANTLKKLDVDSVPINVLVPIAGTAMAEIEPICADDVIRTICIFRLTLKDKLIKIAAGREASLGDRQIEGFEAGANGMIIGGYLTIAGAGPDKDKELIEAVRKRWIG